MCKECSCKVETETIEVDIVLHSPHVTMERKGDLIDLNYCGLDKVFVGKVEEKSLEMNCGDKLTAEEVLEVQQIREDIQNGKMKTYTEEEVKDIIDLDDVDMEDKNTRSFIEYDMGDIFRVSLGFSMRLPKGKMAKMYMRSGTRKNFNVRLTNHVGNLDNGYNGTTDIWKAEFEAIDNGIMEQGDRILQFEIVDVMPEVIFNVVDKLEDIDRGGYSSTGI